MSKTEAVKRIASRWDRCKGCELYKTREKTVHWRGNPEARIALVGEAPGAKEDSTGIPFVGRAGNLLDKILKSVGLEPGRDVFVCNVLACRPPSNRNPTIEESAACKKRLVAMLAIVNPRVIVMLGAQAGKQLAGVSSISQGRKQNPQVELIHAGEIISISGVMTYHPAYALRNPKAVGKIEADINAAINYLEE